MSITTDTEIGQKLHEIVKDHISYFDLDQDIEDVAQYVVVLAGNNRPKDEMTNELQSLFGDQFTTEFVDWVYNQAENLVSGKNNNEPQNTNKHAQFAVDDDEHHHDNGFSGNAGTTLRSRIEGNRHDIPRNGGIGKGVRGPGSFAQRGGGSLKSGMNNNRRGRFGGNNQNLQSELQRDVMGDSNHEDGSNIYENDGSGNNGTVKSKRIRCRHWPTCSYQGCKFWHPTKPCFQYPNCPNPKGTCPYIHIGEDQIPQFVAQQQGQLGLNGGNNIQVMPPPDPQQMGQFPPPPPPVQIYPMGNGFQPQQLPPQMHHQPQPQEPKIQLCKYTEKCTNRECPYAHPTPANDNARVTTFEWCTDKENCKDGDCTKAHPSGSLVRQPEPIPEKVLETCKFLNKCTNMYCRYRHPTTTVVCRNGPDCQRVDCFFTHPYKDDCKYGINCKLSSCLYQHPEGREQMMSKPMVWVNEGENETNNNEDEKMQISNEATA